MFFQKRTHNSTELCINEALFDSTEHNVLKRSPNLSQSMKGNPASLSQFGKETITYQNSSKEVASVFLSQT